MQCVRYFFQCHLCFHVFLFPCVCVSQLNAPSLWCGVGHSLVLVTKQLDGFVKTQDGYVWPTHAWIHVTKHIDRHVVWQNTWTQRGLDGRVLCFNASPCAGTIIDRSHFFWRTRMSYCLAVLCVHLNLPVLKLLFHWVIVYIICLLHMKQPWRTSWHGGDHGWIPLGHWLLIFLMWWCQGSPINLWRDIEQQLCMWHVWPEVVMQTAFLGQLLSVSHPEEVILPLDAALSLHLTINR